MIKALPKIALGAWAWGYCERGITYYWSNKG